VRKLGFVMITVLSTGFATFASSMSTRADDYPWCTQGRSVGYPGDCSYQTYGQCMASASGRSLYCGINPRFAFAQDPRGRRVYRGPYPQW
jgi:hypothetical protein